MENKVDAEKLSKKYLNKRFSDGYGNVYTVSHINPHSSTPIRTKQNLNGEHYEMIVEWTEEELLKLTPTG